MTRELPLPADDDAETTLIGMLSSAEFGDILPDTEFLRPGDFHTEKWGTAWHAALTLRDEGKAVNSLSLNDKLHEWDAIGEGRAIASIADITACANNIPPNANARQLAESVRKTALRRLDIKRAAALHDAAYRASDADWERERAEAMAYLSSAPATKARSKEPRFRLLSDDEIMNLKPAAGIVGDILFEDTTAFLYAREGRWKTFLALDWTMSCATGRDWLGRKVKQGPAIYIAAEGALGIGMRIAAWKVHHQVTEKTAIKVLGQAVQLMNASEVREFVSDIRTQLGESKPVLVVIDTLARSMSGGHEYDAKDANAVSDAASLIRAAFGCCVLIVHHTGYDQSHMRGSTAFRGNADTIIHITASDDREPIIKPGEPITVQCEKPREAVPFADITLTAKSVSVAREDGVTFDSLVMVPAEPAAVQPKALTENQQKALDTLYLAEAGLRAKKWLAATEIPERSFYDARDALAAQELRCVAKDAQGTYSVTAEGEKRVTAKLLRPQCEGDSRTANGAEADVEEDPEFMGSEPTAELRFPIGASQFRSNGHAPAGFVLPDRTGPPPPPPAGDVRWLGPQGKWDWEQAWRSGKAG